MTYLIAAYGAGLLILGLYAAHLARSLREAERWFEGPKSSPGGQGTPAGR